MNLPVKTTIIWSAITTMVTIIPIVTIVMAIIAITIGLAITIPVKPARNR